MPPDRDIPPKPGHPARPQEGEVYIEFRQVGQAVRVAAVDAATGTEVVIMGPASASQNELKSLALRKLKAQMAKGDAGGK